MGSAFTAVDVMLCAYWRDIDDVVHVTYSRSDPSGWRWPHAHGHQLSTAALEHVGSDFDGREPAAVTCIECAVFLLREFRFMG